MIFSGETQRFTQLSLFHSFEEQVGTVAAAEASMKYTMPAAFSLPQNELETILRSGGGKQHSRKRIFAKYTEGRNAEQMVDFLKNEYGQTGKGFEINGNPVSVWFDEHGGMSVGLWNTGKGNTDCHDGLGRCEESYPFGLNAEKLSGNQQNFI